MPYMNVTEVESALTALAATYPSTCELITLPNTTHEARTSHAVRLSLGALNNRPAMLFVGGQHAREWGSAEICVNFATDLLEAYDTNSGLAYGGQSYSAATIKHLIEDAQIFVFACANPDGRNHSQMVSAMWRKNRNPAGAVDLNRNYDLLWDFNTALHPDSGARVSDNPADDTYHGTAPLSEPEAQNVVWLLDTFPQIRWSIDIHSYGRLLYHAWGHDQNQVVDPNQNFQNNAFDGLRGIPDDAYGEYITTDNLGTQCGLVESMQTAIAAVRGESYRTGQTFSLYPTTGTLSAYPFSRHLSNPALTKTHGFLIEWGTIFQPAWSEMQNIILDVSAGLVAFADAALEECGVLDITLETPTLQFIDVPEGETTFRAVTFKVTACCTVDFEITDGPDVVSGPPGTAFGTPLSLEHSAPPAPSSYSKANLWVSYQGTNASDSATGTVTVFCKQTRQEWVVPITTNVIARPTAEVMLVFDQSNSMSHASGLGAGVTRADVLRFSAPPVVDVIEDGNGLGILRFDHDTHDTMPMTEVDLVSRITANGHISGYAHNPDGWTSIGGAVARARDLIDDTAVDKDVKAMVVLTDGAEMHNGFTRQYISDVAGSIDGRVYAIGLGTPENLQPGALTDLCAGNDGYMLITGALDTNALFKLTKYYQQILAGVTNNQIVVDPQGAIAPGQVHKIPFKLAETDISSDVLLFSPFPAGIHLTLQAPDGNVITPAVASVNPGITMSGGAYVRFYRMTLPVVLSGGGGGHEGTWHAILEVDRIGFKRYIGSVHEHESVSFATTSTNATHGIPYSVMSRAYSNLRMNASLSQTGNEPGALLHVRAALSEYGVPVENRASVLAEVTAPDGSASVVTLHETEPGVFTARKQATLAGVYTWHVLASGKTFRGTPFTREQWVTGAVWRGGDRPPEKPTDNDFCDFLACLLGSKKGRKLLKKCDIDERMLKRCLKRCRRQHGKPR